MNTKLYIIIAAAIVVVLSVLLGTGIIPSKFSQKPANEPVETEIVTIEAPETEEVQIE